MGVFYLFFSRLTLFPFPPQHQGQLGYEIQGATSELVNGLVRIIRQLSILPDCVACAMSALTRLHSDTNILLWNPEDPAASVESSSNALYVSLIYYAYNYFF